MSDHRRVTVVTGAGPGLGRAIMQTFAARGDRVIGLSRTPPKDETEGAAHYQVDLAKRDQVEQAVEDIARAFGPPAVLIHNLAQLVIKPFLETTPEEFEACWRSMHLSCVHTVHAVLPLMLENGDGSIVISGATASIRGGARFSAFASAKFALRGLAQALAREFQPQGIHVAHVLLDGIIDTEQSRQLHGLKSDKMLKPVDIAAAYLQLVEQPPSAWTHELDLRPSSERF